MGQRKGSGGRIAERNLVPGRWVGGFRQGLGCRCRPRALRLYWRLCWHLRLRRCLRRTLHLRRRLRLGSLRSLLLGEFFLVEVAHDAGYVMARLLVGRNAVVLLDSLGSRVVRGERLDEV